MTENYWVASLNGEDYDNVESESKLGAIERLFELVEEDGEDYDYGYVAQVALYKPSIDTEMVLEKVSNDAYHECPEYAGDYLVHVPDEQFKALEKKLNIVLAEWINEYNQEPNFFLIKNVEKIDVGG
jgi:hypothetical protein